ncbi:MAG: hypothetical protein KDC84_00980 [Crocinitomicaceae bacterium]|nr:hypothetical protein [Crocinitomicaceae bacterium]
MIGRIYILFVGLVVVSCSTDMGEEEEPVKPKQPARLDVKPPEYNKPDDGDSTLNETDSLGRKIGKWETEVDGQVWKTEFYKDGKLHGLQTQKLDKGKVLETHFANGKKNGISQEYQDGAKVADYLTIYQNDKRVFSTFPKDLAQGNFKKIIFSTELDSIDLKINYLSGKKLYEGKILKKSNIRGVPVGEHKVFYENGQTKYLLNFEKDSIYQFDTKGNPKDTSFFSYEKKIWPVYDGVKI